MTTTINSTEASKNKNKLIDKSSDGGGPAKSKKKTSTPKWAGSAARAFLLNLLKDPTTNATNMTPMELFKSHKVFFLNFEYRNFYTNLRNMKGNLEEEIRHVKFDEDAFKHEQKLFPRNQFTNRGEPFWPGHAADSKLSVDVKNGKANSMKPAKLQQTDEAYQAFSAKPFRKRIYQEKRKQRELVAWQFKRNKEAQKDHLEEVSAMRDEYGYGRMM